MRYPLPHSVLAILIISLVLIGLVSCGKRPTDNNQTEPPPPIPLQAMSLNDTVVIAQAGPVDGIVVDSSYEIDVSSAVANLHCKVDDIAISYNTPTEGLGGYALFDVAHWIWNYRTETWDQISTDKTVLSPPGITFRNQKTIASLKLQVDDYFGDSHILKIKPYYKILPDTIPDSILGRVFDVTLVTYNDNYQPIYLNPLDHYCDNCCNYNVTYDGESYWILSGCGTVDQMSIEGELLSTRFLNGGGHGLTKIPDGYAYSLVSDEQIVIILDEKWELQGSFSAERLPYFSSLTFFEDRLLVLCSNYFEDPHGDLIYFIDIDSSINAGVVIITDSINSAVRLNSIDNDGEYIIGNGWGSSSGIYRLFSTGEVKDHFVLPFYRPRDIFCANGILHIITPGPNGVWSGRPVLVRIRFP